MHLFSRVSLFPAARGFAGLQVCAKFAPPTDPVSTSDKNQELHACMVSERRPPPLLPPPPPEPLRTPTQPPQGGWVGPWGHLNFLDMVSPNNHSGPPPLVACMHVWCQSCMHACHICSSDTQKSRASHCHHGALTNWFAAVAAMLPPHLLL